VYVTFVPPWLLGFAEREPEPVETEPKFESVALVAFDVVQVSVTVCPSSMDVSLALSVHVGAL
jgi:hypothetical protein